MFEKLMKRFFAPKQEDKTDADAKIATLEKEDAELKAMLEHQIQKIEKIPIETKPGLDNQHALKASVAVSPTPVTEKKISDFRQTPNSATFMNVSFHNRVLMGIWRGKGVYMQENGRPVDGEMRLDVECCCFYLPSNKLDPHLKIKLQHGATHPIRIEKEMLTVVSPEGIYRFIIHEKDRDTLQLWWNKLQPELEKVRKFPSVFLTPSDCDDVFAHPFLKKHAADSMEVRTYLRQKFPVFGEKISWYDETVSVSVEEGQTQFQVSQHSSGEWFWSETENQLKIVLSKLEVGFFDDSEREFLFEYTISYLGDDLKDGEAALVNNAKLQQPLPRTKWSATGEDAYIAAYPFGLKGFYGIAWKAIER